MILSDKTIKQKLKSEEIIIKPYPEEIQPSSVDLRLGNEFWSPVKTEEVLDIKNNEPKYNIINANAIVLPPNEFILATIMNVHIVKSALMYVVRNVLRF